MSTWTFKAHVFAIVTMLTVAACDELPQTLGGGSQAISQTSMAGGDVLLTAPNGYCIDRRSKRDRFALIGRCDTLGAEGFFNAWDLAIITVSITEVAPGTTNPRATDIAAAPDAGEVQSTIERESIALVQMDLTSSSIEGVGNVFWRTAFVVNDQLVSASLYAPPDSAALGREGARILQSMVRRTDAATQQAAG